VSVALRQLAAVRAKDEAVVEVLRRPLTERLGERPVQRLVRPMIGPPQNVRDPEVDVVDHAGELIRGRSVPPQECRSPPAQRALVVLHVGKP
jgi:hypothetical protein